MLNMLKKKKNLRVFYFIFIFFKLNYLKEKKNWDKKLKKTFSTIPKSTLDNISNRKILL